VKARDARNARYLVERQRLAEMAFDVPERFLGWVHGRWPCSKHRHHARSPRVSFDSPCSVAPEPRWFRDAEISSNGLSGKKGLSGNIIPIVHTATLH
jgi:hypothetical protein